MGQISHLITFTIHVFSHLDAPTLLSHNTSRLHTHAPPLQSEDLVCLDALPLALSSPPPNPDYLFIRWLPAEGDAVAMGTFSPLSGLPLVSVGCSCLSRLQPQEPNPRWKTGWGWGITQMDPPEPQEAG